MSNRFRSLRFRNENELEQILLADLEVIEQGLIFIDNQVPIGSGFIDILARDIDGTLVILEVKLDEDDRMLQQALEYYDFVLQNLERFAQAYPNAGIVALAEPRVILVAGSYSTRLVASAKFITVPLNLFTYQYLELSGNKGLYLAETQIAPVREIGIRRKSVNEHLDYITDKGARAVAEKVIQWLVSQDPENIVTKGLRHRISVKYRGNNFVDILPRRSFIVINWRDRWNEPAVQIAQWADFTDDMQQALLLAYASMGGIPADSDNMSEEQDVGQ